MNTNKLNKQIDSLSLFASQAGLSVQPNYPTTQHAAKWTPMETPVTTTQRLFFYHFANSREFKDCICRPKLLGNRNEITMIDRQQWQSSSEQRQKHPFAKVIFVTVFISQSAAFLPTAQAVYVTWTKSPRPLRKLLAAVVCLLCAHNRLTARKW